MDAPPDIRIELRSLTEWRALIESRPEVQDHRYIDGIVKFGTDHGIISASLGHVPPELVESRDANHRESFLAAGLNPRHRAVLDVIAGDPVACEPNRPRIHGHEAISLFALRMRGRYPFFIGSEYSADPVVRDALFPVPLVDIAASPFPDSVFDFVVSNDVFEHVPDLDGALRDIARVLRPRGKLIATFPFLYNSETTAVKVMPRADGGVDHLVPPEHHGDPVNPATGSLVFRLPAWDIIGMANRAGFGDAHMLFWSSHASGITGADAAGIFILVARAVGIAREAATAGTTPARWLSRTFRRHRR